MGFLEEYLQDQRGASAVEYVAILGLIGTAIAAAAIAFGAQIAQALQQVGTAVLSSIVW